MSREALKAAKDSAYLVAKRASRTADAHLGSDGLRALTHVLYERVKCGATPLDDLVESAARGELASAGAGNGSQGGAAALMELAEREAARLAATSAGGG